MVIVVMMLTAMLVMLTTMTAITMTMMLLMTGMTMTMMQGCIPRMMGRPTPAFSFSAPT